VALPEISEKKQLQNKLQLLALLAFIFIQLTSRQYSDFLVIQAYF